MPTLSLIILGAAPVPPLIPSTTITSAPALTIPLAIAAEEAFDHRPVQPELPQIVPVRRSLLAGVSCQPILHRAVHALARRART